MRVFAVMVMSFWLRLAVVLLGSAELSTLDGLIDVSATNVDLRGALQVLNTSYDQTVDDISISATGGAVQFDGGASSANRIVIAQNSTDGLDGVTATGALVAEQLVVTADGNVDLQTDVDVVEVTSGAAVTVSEENDAVFEVSSARGAYDSQRSGRGSSGGWPSGYCSSCIGSGYR